MSSLGLEDGASHSRNVRSFLRPRSHSNASSSSDIDDERDQSSQQYTPSGAYLFVSADCDRRDYTNFVEVDAPRVSRRGRYSPYPTDSVRINRSVASTRLNCSCCPLGPKESKPSLIARDRESEEGTSCAYCCPK